MKHLFIIFSLLVSVFGCNNPVKVSQDIHNNLIDTLNKGTLTLPKSNHRIEGGEISYDISIDSLCTYTLILPKNFKINTESGNSITIKDSLTQKKVSIEPCSDWVYEKNGLSFEHKTFKEFVAYRALCRFSFDETGLIKSIHNLNNYKEFKNNNDVKIYRTGLIFETETEDSIVTKSKCPPIYMIEIPNVKIEKGYIDRALFCAGDSLMIERILSKFEFKK